MASKDRKMSKQGTAWKWQKLKRGCGFILRWIVNHLCYKETGGQLWWFVTSSESVKDLFSNEISRKHSGGPWWPWAYGWRRYPSGILL